jgi:predicted transcriptional regulator
MSTKKTENRDGAVLAFLSGRGPNPIPENKRNEAGPLTKKFMDEAMLEIAEQDKANESKAPPSVADDLMAVMRLVSDNHEMIQLIQSRGVSTVSDLAVAMGRELSNVSRTLSRMAAYGLIGFEEGSVDARSKRPIWLLPELPGHEDLDWVQVYCLAMALKNRKAGLKTASLSAMEMAVRGVIEAATEKIELARATAPSP